MPYLYEVERRNVFSEEGQVMFLKIRDKAMELIKQSGCAMMDWIIAGNTGDSWTMLACVDRLVELKELEEINYGRCAGQHRIFVAPKITYPLR